MSVNMADTVAYFGYASNLLKERIHIGTPSAEFYSIAKLQGYRLTFDHQDADWKGAKATIEVAGPTDSVWGAIWRISPTDMYSLGAQDGEDKGTFRQLDVRVTTPEEEQVSCFCFMLTDRGDADRRPSPQYLDVIVQGAIQSGLPADYIEKLKTVEHNGYSGQVDIYDTVQGKH